MGDKFSQNTRNGGKTFPMNKQKMYATSWKSSKKGDGNHRCVSHKQYFGP